MQLHAKPRSPGTDIERKNILGSRSHVKHSTSERELRIYSPSMSVPGLRIGPTIWLQNGSAANFAEHVGTDTSFYGEQFKIYQMQQTVHFKNKNRNA